MDTSHLQSDIEALVTLTVQILDAARSGNPVLMDDCVSRRDSLLTRIEESVKAAPPKDAKARRQLSESIAMVQKLDREIKELVEIQQSKALKDLRSLDSNKKQILDESATDQKGQRLRTHG